MAIDWSLAKAPTSQVGNVPESGTTQMLKGMQLGAQTAVAPGMAQAGLQQAQAQGVLAQADAANAPQMAQMKQAMMSGAIKSADLENAMKTYTMAQNILGPSAMAVNNGDMAGAADIYERGVVALKNAGIDTASVGAPDKFDPNYVKSAFSNVSQQMAMAKQMMDMAQGQSMIDYHDSIKNKNSADVGKINYETGSNYPTGGAFTGLGGPTPQSSGAASGQISRVGSGLTPKGQSEVNQKQAEEAIKTRASLGSAAGKARSQEGVLNDAMAILNKNPIAAGKLGYITKHTNKDIERLNKIYQDLFLGKVNTEFSGQGLGSLDESVSKTIKTTLPDVSDYHENQVKAVQNNILGVKASQLQNDVAIKLNDAGIYDENVRIRISNEILNGMGVRSGSTINLENFKKAPAVMDKVMQQYGVSSAQKETPVTPGNMTSEQIIQRESAIKSGFSPTALDNYYKKLNEKQR